MLKFNERAANTVQNPESPDKVLFLNPDGVLQLKDSAGTLTNLVAENATGQSTARPFKVYKALLTQVSKHDPTLVVLENTLGDSVSALYGDTGEFTLNTALDVFTNNKTFTPGVLINATIGDERSLAFNRVSAKILTVFLKDNTFAPTNGCENVPILIEVYP